MPRAKSKREESPDKRRWLFSLFLNNAPELRIYAWTKQFRRGSGALNHRIRELILAELDATHFMLSNEDAQIILLEEGLVDAVPTRSTTIPHRQSSTLSLSTRDDEDDITL